MLKTRLLPPFLMLFFFLLTHLCNGAEPETTDNEKAFTAFSASTKLPVLRVPCLDKGPVIDGKVDKLYQEKGKPITLKYLNGSKRKPVNPTTGYILSDKDHLYILTICETPFPDAVFAKQRRRDSSVWTDEVVEIFIDPSNMRQDLYYQISVNLLGTTMDARNRSDKTWNPDLEVGTSKKKKEKPRAWIMEMKIPFKDLVDDPEKINTIWSLNLNRTARREPVPPETSDDVDIEDTAWSPTYSGSSHRPQMFGYLWLDAGTILNLPGSESETGPVSVEDEEPIPDAAIPEVLLDESKIVEEYAVKRKTDTFAFAKKPVLTRKKDTVSIEFETQTLCDVCITIEDSQRKILRHLAYGLLGPNAPAPFVKNSKHQVITWDGKDDNGRYLADSDTDYAKLTVRVSLGLTPRYERSLSWSPHKRVGTNPPVIHAAKEGVYVCESNFTEQIRLFDHDGNYIRTVYPFPAASLTKIRGIKYMWFPQDGKKLPLKFGHPQSTLLTSTRLAWGRSWPTGFSPESGRAMTFRPASDNSPPMVYILNQRLNRVPTRLTDKVVRLNGPVTAFPTGVGHVPSVAPSSIALSPDGKWMYMTGYFFAFSSEAFGGIDTLHGVARMDPEGTKGPRLFLGSMRRRKYGSDNTRFHIPSSVDCDSKGRVYISDYMNNRIQIFSESKTFLGTINVKRPARVRINRKTDEIYAISYPLKSIHRDRFQRSRTGTLTVFNAFANGSAQSKISVQFPVYAGKKTNPFVEIDFHTDPPVLWMNKRPYGIILMELNGNNLRLKRDFLKDVHRVTVQHKPPKELRQKLYTHPGTGKLYAGETMQPYPVHIKTHNQLIEVDPQTNRTRFVKLPFLVDEADFDVSGHLLCRDSTKIARFRIISGGRVQEVPFDYGETRKGLISVIPLISTGGIWHMQGFGVSPVGDMVVSCQWPLSRQKGKDVHRTRLYPGRMPGYEIHVLDKYGKMKFMDALPGVHDTNGLDIDRNGNIYAMMNVIRVADGKRYPTDISCTYIKAKPGEIRIIKTGGVPVPLNKNKHPDRPADIVGHAVGAAWIEGAEWIHGGVGQDGKNVDNESVGRNCSCVANCRPALDFFGRSFLPEPDHYSVVVLDTAGNVITRIGQYGNVEDGVPLIADGGPPTSRKIGGDEVALVHPLYLSTHSDRRLFISDMGNYRIVSVKLGYQTTKKTRIK